MESLGGIVLMAGLLFVWLGKLYRGRRAAQRYVYLNPPEVLYFRFDLRRVIDERNGSGRRKR